MTFAPGEQAALDAAIRKIVNDLIGGTGLAAANPEQVLHIRDLEIRDAPAPDGSLRAQAFERLHDNAKIPHAGAPVQQVEVQIVGCQARQACRASGPDSVSRGVRGPHLGDHEYLVALTRDDAPDHLLGVSVSVNLGRVEECHAERYARAQRFLLLRGRVPPAGETRRALAQGRD